MTSAFVRAKFASCELRYLRFLFLAVLPYLKSLVLSPDILDAVVSKNVQQRVMEISVRPRRLD